MTFTLADILKTDKKPKKGLFAAEWAMVAYMAFTLLLMLFTYTKLHDPESMLWGRARIAIATAALWGIYRIAPCRLLRFLRIALQMTMLSWWYPDTYEFNRMFPNLDHIFATWEQQLFGCQPSLLFCQALPGHVFSELMDLGYAAYFPMILAITVFLFMWRYKDFDRASFIIMASFFSYYVIYVLLPVAGPQYYYKAVGMEEITAGNFPDVGDYFSTHSEALESPGYKDGFFYKLVDNAHDAGERPTAAFPSSHVGISTIIMILAWRARSRRFFYALSPFYVLLCFSTVYIYAHYVIDVFAGWLSALVFFAAFNRMYKKTESHRLCHHHNSQKG